MLGFLGGTFDIISTFYLVVLSGLIGWGIRNKKLKYKTFMLRKMCFMVDEKPEAAELYQRLLPTFNSLNIKMEANEKGIICVSYNGLYYDIVFNEDDSFSIQWHQSFAKAFLRQGYYIGIYKKILVAMGLIAYHVQKVCLNDNEMYYTQEEK